MVVGEFRKQVYGLFFYLMYNIDYRVIAVTYNGNDAVCEFNRLWFIGQQTRTFAQLFNGNYFNVRFLQTFCQFRTCRVNCDIVVCDQNIDIGVWGDVGQYVIYQSRNTIAYQRRDDDGKRRGNRGIVVIIGSITQYVVRVGQYVNVELGVNFQRVQYYYVETINRCVFRILVSVLVGVDFDVIGVTGQRLRSMVVKVLYIQQFADQIFFVQVNYRRGNIVKGEVGANIAVTYFVFQETGYRQRCVVGVGLYGEIFFEVVRVDNYIRSVTGNKQFARVSGYTGRVSVDFCSIVNAVNFDD